MTFSLRIKALREERGLSQARLASALSVGVGSVGMWESTQEVPPAKKLIRIADFFEVSIDYLIGRSDIKSVASTSELSEEEEQFLALFQRLEHGERVQLLAFAAGLVGKEKLYKKS